MSWPLVAAEIHSNIYEEQVDERRTTSMRTSTVLTRTSARQGEGDFHVLDRDGHHPRHGFDERMNDGERAA
eukprot:2495913-Heterocapsa_arctica.AAC.1